MNKREVHLAVIDDSSIVFFQKSAHTRKKLLARQYVGYLLFRTSVFMGRYMENMLGITVSVIVFKRYFS